ncbi:MAG: hypothetical protein ISS78_04390 [Phycisphaerae bacterium]|nr:hypothetical protein [Phycisphaerae bacterium]
MPDEPTSRDEATGQGPYRRDDGALDAIGQRHLANALRVSFTVLAVVMILVVILFFFSGTKIIEPQKRGIKTIFGRVAETVDQGLAMTWPFPIGDIEEIDIREQSLPITEFWMKESQENVGKPKRGWRVESEGLRPGWDGALFTGDHNLIHVKLDCTLMIADPLAVMANLRDAKTIQAVMENILSSAAIRSAATKTADGLLRTQRDEFVNEIKADAQRRLNVLTLDRRKVADLQSRLRRMLSSLEPEKRDAAQNELTRLMSLLMLGLRDKNTRNDLLAATLPSTRKEIEGLLAALLAEFDHDGIRINRVKVVDITWPIRALPAYEAAQKAEAEKDVAISKARGEAARILSNAAGRSYRKLIDAAKVLGEEPKAQPKGERDLVGQYIRARNRGNEDQARRLWSKIDSVLVSNETGGEASRLIAEARTFRTKTEQGVAARVDEFNKKIQGYEKAPQITLDRLWADTRDRILSNPMAEKFYLTMSKDKTVLRISRDPAVMKRIRELLLKKKKAKGGAGESGNKK